MTGYGIVLTLTLLVSQCWSQRVGWTSYVQQETSEFSDVPLQWELDCFKTNAIPPWLKGQLLKNGPGRTDFGGVRRHTSWMDGFAKLHSFKFNGNTSDVLYSARFINSRIYQRCLEKGDLVPYMTLAPVAPTDWTWSETWEAAKAKFDNTNVMVWKYKSKDPTVPDDIVANTDAPYVNRFDPNTLNYQGIVFPDRKSMASSAHPHIEPGTDHTINFGVTYDWKMASTFEIYRYTTFKDAQVIASFVPRRMAYIHSFSITENYAIFFFYPAQISLWNMMTSGMHPIDALVWIEGVPTDVYVVNLKTGAVVMTAGETRPLFSAHHINAYETKDGKIVVDLCETPFKNMASYMLLENMLAGGEGTVRDLESLRPEDGETMGLATSGLRRFLIDLDAKSVDEVMAPEIGQSSPFWIDGFDFPTINEAHRGQHYCYAYGVVMMDYALMKLVKRSLCDPSKDRVYGELNHFYSEMNFVANPSGDGSEDDGVLTTVAFDGVNKKSYLLILDAKELTLINKAPLPYRMPYHFHGNFFAH